MMNPDRTKGANPTRRGEAHPDAKMTAEKVRAMRKEWRAKLVTQRELATKYNISQAACNKILRGITWKHVR